MPMVSRLYALDLWLASISPYAHLLVVPLTITDATTLADLVEASWGDYASLPMGPWTPAVPRGANAESYGERLVWTRLSGGPSTWVWGYYATDGLTGPLLWIDLVGSAGPQLMEAGGEPLSVWPLVRWGPDAPAVSPIYVVGRRVGGGIYAPPDEEGLDVRVSFDSENKDSVTLSPGMALATHSSGNGVIRANATIPARAAAGLALDSAAPATSGRTQTSGIVTLSDWSAATGTTTLTPDAVYYLDVADGGLTATAPTATGQIVQQIGRAVSSTSLALSIQEAILL